jgi:hypothetical protein
MSLNLKAIEACLKDKPLVQGVLYDPRRDCRCAVGELLHCCGVDDKELALLDTGHFGLNEGYMGTILALGGEQFKTKYGITNKTELDAIFNSNDDHLQPTAHDVIEGLIQRLDLA